MMSWLLAARPLLNRLRTRRASSCPVVGLPRHASDEAYGLSNKSKTHTTPQGGLDGAGSGTTAPAIPQGLPTVGAGQRGNKAPPSQRKHLVKTQRQAPPLANYERKHVGEEDRSSANPAGMGNMFVEHGVPHAWACWVGRRYTSNQHGAWPRPVLAFATSKAAALPTRCSVPAQVIMRASICGPWREPRRHHSSKSWSSHWRWPQILGPFRRASPLPWRLHPWGRSPPDSPPTAKSLLSSNPCAEATNSAFGGGKLVAWIREPTTG